jgi:hypothetical protein
MFAIPVTCARHGRAYCNLQTKKPPAGGFDGRNQRSAFGELLAASRFVQADFLALDFARIARYQPGFLQHRLQSCVKFNQRARNAMTHRARLS